MKECQVYNIPTLKYACGLFCVRQVSSSLSIGKILDTFEAGIEAAELSLCLSIYNLILQKMQVILKASSKDRAVSLIRRFTLLLLEFDDSKM